jgi:hypothetical protein
LEEEYTEPLPKGAVLVTLGDLKMAEQELIAELELSGDGELLPEHRVADVAGPCARCTLVAMKAVEIRNSRLRPQN